MVEGVVFVYIGHFVQVDEEFMHSKQFETQGTQLLVVEMR